MNSNRAGTLLFIALVSAAAQSQILAEVVAIRHSTSLHSTVPVSAMVQPRRTAALAFEAAGRIDEYLVDIGDEVVKGQPLVRQSCPARAANKTLAEARLDQGQVQFAQAKRRLTRAQRLFRDSGAVTQQEKEDAEDLADTSAANIEVLQATVSVAQVAVNRCVLTAPWDGMVDVRVFDEGVVTAAGVSVLQLTEHKHIKIVATVPHTLSRNLAVGAEATVLIDDVSYPVRLVRRSALLQQNTRGVQAEWQFAQTVALNSREILGRAVLLEIRSEVKNRSGFWVPATALIEGVDGLWAVFVLDEQSRAQERSIRVMYRDNKRAFITGQLQDKDRLIASGGRLTVIPGVIIKPIVRQFN